MRQRFKDDRRNSIPIGRLGKNQMRQGVQWRGPGLGKFVKGQYNQAMRRFGKLFCREGERAYRHMHDAGQKLSQVKWKGT